MKRALLFLVVACSVTSLFATTAQESVREPSSKVEFPVTLTAERLAKGVTPDAKGAAPVMPDMQLTGTGLRTKTWFDIKVYAMGLYVDGKQARAKLAAWSGKNAKQLGEDQTFYSALLKDDFGKTLRLVMCRDVDGDDMAEAFDDSLGPRMTQAIDKDELRGSKQDLEVFRKYFSIDEVEEDVELLFTWMPGGKLYTRVDGKFVGVIDSPALCWSLYDIYFGTDPITKKGKEGMVNRFPAMLAATATK